jgi:hypothetical protein
VIILEFEGLTKVYPQRILNRHEIVNDWFGDTPIAISYCPLCGSAVAFQRIVDGKITQFGVSGYLHNSDLVMYDRLEGSLWQQITGEAITGPAARRDEKIKPILLIVLPWAEASSKYPRAEVLSRDTGLPESSYNTYPYGDYETDDAVYFPVSGNDNRLHSKAWVYGIEINGQTAAFEENKLKPGKQTYEVGSLIVEVTYENDIASFKNQETGEEIVPLKLFWFAWASFNPDTLLF